MKQFLILMSLMFFAIGLSYGQRTITGTVSDGTETLIGANVLVKGTTIGVATDFDGKFSLEVPDDAQFIEISYTGYSTQEVDITGQSEFNIVMQEGETLQEAVVLGYRSSTKPKSNVAVKTLSSSTIQDRPNPSVVQTLQGQVAGLNIVTSSGQPGGNSEIILRGVNSIGGNVEPLFIIDGVPVDEDNFRSINQNEIESVTVLKDAGATAIYGNRGANGVIVIKTKNGGYNSGLKIRYSGQVSRSSRQAIDYDLMDAQEQLRLEAKYGSGRGSTISEDSIGRVQGTDWLDVFLRDPITHSHNLALSFGGENFNVYSNFGYLDSEGILIDSKLERYNWRTNLTGKSADEKFSYGTNISLNYSKNNEPNSVGSSAINRNYVLGAFQSVPYISLDEYVDGAGLLSPLTFANTPLFLWDRVQTYTRFENELKAILSIDASYKIAEGLTFSSTLGGDFTDQNLTRAEGPESFNALLFAETGNTTPGFQDQANTRVFSYNWLNSLNYTKQFGGAHTIDVGLYTEYFRAFYDRFGYRNEGLDPRTFYPGDGSGFIDDNSDNDFFADQANANILKAGLFSYFGSLDYDYGNKYGIGFTLRRDASYRFASSNKWGTFYAVSARWNINEESFMEGSPFNLLKLRASYGTTGNQRIVDSGGFLNYFGGGDLTENFFATSSGYGGSNSIGLSQIGNSTLKWETVNQVNVGLDFELLSNRLRGAVDVYQKTTEDLFQGRPISAVNATTLINANTGSLRNRGFDFDISYDFLVNPNGLNMRAYFNTNFNKQEIIDLPTPDGTIQSGNVITREGSILREYYVYQYAGVNPANGNLLFLDANGDITENPSPDTDRVYTDKNRYADYQGGFGMFADYKGIFLDLSFNYVTGVYKFDFDLAGAMDPTNIGQFRHSRDMLKAWENPGDVTNVASLNATNLALDSSSDRWLMNASYLRLRFIRLGYNFSPTIVNKLGVSNLGVYFNAENVVTWTPWRGYDVETTETQRGYPAPRTLSLGLDIEF